MKKVILTIFLILITIAVKSGYIYANSDSGSCANCHTMHNSQSGASVTGGAGNDRLLNAGCIGCHTGTTGKTNTHGAPVVLHTTSPGNTATAQGAGKTNAGGDFYWVNADENKNAAKGHNVIDLSSVTSQDINMTNFNPPGWDPDATRGYPFGQIAGGEGVWSSQLTCAGKYGCHGNHLNEGSLKGIQGSHHNNLHGGGSDGAGSDNTGTRAQTADTVGNSYRFLGGIKGLEDENWNWSETPTLHNEYYGENYIADRSSGNNYGSKNTMSFLCAQCHGEFHSEIDSDSKSGSPWVRHPTDIALPASGEYDDYNSDNADNTAGLYSLEAPVARATVPAMAAGAVTPGTDIVMCLSCHRAHGSPVNDLLRWDYSTMIAGGGSTNGCFTCHTDLN